MPKNEPGPEIEQHDITDLIERIEALEKARTEGEKRLGDCEDSIDSLAETLKRRK